MQELTEDARNQYQRLRQNIAPPSPRSPQALRSLLRQYASHVFESEATYFPDEKDLEHWLQRLSGNIVSEIMQRVIQVENVGRARYVTLDYHGLTREDMINAIREGAREAANGRLDYAEAQRLAAVAAVMDEQGRGKLNTQAPTQTKESTRKGFVEPLLLAKGWSMLQWALEAEVAYNTVADYLAGKKNPHSRTRVKLAKALGTTANLLPD